VKVTFIIISELQSTAQLMNATNAFSRDPGILSPPWTFPHGHSPGYISLNVKAYANDVNKG